MSLRSAKNAGFDVPKATIDDAVAYVRRCFQPKYGRAYTTALVVLALGAPNQLLPIFQR
jgi:hypothetical protein